MTIATSSGDFIDAKLLKNYFKKLVNSFFKILPMKENQEDSLDKYLRSLQRELIGCQSLITAIQEDSLYLTLLAILQYIIDHPDCSTKEVRRDVFRAISICNQLEATYFEEVAT